MSETTANGLQAPSQPDLIRQAEARGMRMAAISAAQWRQSDEVLLRAGEMTAQELRTARAVAGGIERAILAMADKHERGEG